MSLAKIKILIIKGAKYGKAVNNSLFPLLNILFKCSGNKNF